MNILWRWTFTVTAVVKLAVILLGQSRDKATDLFSEPAKDAAAIYWFSRIDGFVFHAWVLHQTHGFR
jgi:hypothetical protein